MFFKIRKSYLKLTNGFQQLSYDALTAYTTIVMMRYMILSIEKRRQEDPRSIGELYFISCDEMDDIKFERALALLIDLLAHTLRDSYLGLTEEQMDRIMDNFISQLPLHFHNCLIPNLAS